ncbi:MAG: hypothetical protein OEX81_01010 [Candidatus Pacebacteria bacterium]|nr:hypothetical protein [Candidatus Paceibacterota bacterium]
MAVYVMQIPKNAPTHRKSQILKKIESYEWRLNGAPIENIPTLKFRIITLKQVTETEMAIFSDVVKKWRQEFPDDQLDTQKEFTLMKCYVVHGGEGLPYTLDEEFPPETLE